MKLSIYAMAATIGGLFAACFMAPYYPDNLLLAFQILCVFGMIMSLSAGVYKYGGDRLGAKLLETEDKVNECYNRLRSATETVVIADSTIESLNKELEYLRGQLKRERAENKKLATIVGKL